MTNLIQIRQNEKSKYCQSRTTKFQDAHTKNHPLHVILLFNGETLIRKIKNVRKMLVIV